jgi:predicted choloylglycine hydrolase
MKQFPIAKVKGTAYDAGVEIGKILRLQIQTRLIKNRQATGDRYIKMLDNISPFLEPSQKYFPEIITEMKGIAVGAEVDFADIFLGNCMELLDIDRDADMAEHCTIIAIPINGSYVLSHNEDALGYSGEDLYVLDGEIDGNKILGLAYADGMIGTSVAVNGFGLVQAINSLPNIDLDKGVPRNIISRAILNCQTLAEVENILKNIPRASGYNHVLIQNDELWNIESTATHYRINKYNLKPFVHTNHYLSDISQNSHDIPGFHVEESQRRFTKVYTLFKEIKSIDDLKNIMSDTHEPAISKTKTIGSCVLDWAGQSAYICVGQPKPENYYQIDLNR